MPCAQKYNLGWTRESLKIKPSQNQDFAKNEPPMGESQKYCLTSKRQNVFLGYVWTS